ncbi:hypothetical protein J4G52_25115 [Burkholderia cenocepacia]|uniref:hypothetical protein n=1 Tax=Burkholderia cenocepacia TaxID=95486 RepID=UPI001AA154BF|nr:hypothetical protein [Burkholderia cenocepacia]MBO1856823.1 hypothetical protein [Burkholderia cenocepacia]
MRQLFALALCAWSAEEQAEEAIRECSRLSAAIAIFLLRRRESPARLASAVADMELICARLRLIIGEDLVDLEKVASLARLQARLVAAAQPAAMFDVEGAHQ